MAVQQSTRKKAQIEMSESILVLFVIVIIIAIGVFIYYKYSIANIGKIGERISEEDATILLSSIMNMPELRCDSSDCLDTSKILPFEAAIRANMQYYGKVLGNKRITLEQIYPQTQEKECTVIEYNKLEYPNNCNTWIVYDNKLPNYKTSFKVSTVVPLYFPENEEFRIGRLNIEVFK